MLCIPTFLVHEIVPIQYEDDDNDASSSIITVGYVVDLASMESADACNMFKINLWLTGILLKVD
jgi:hypothetical protein